MRTTAAALALLLCLSTRPSQALAADPDALARDVAAAVDLPTAKERAAAAAALAARADVDLDGWLAALGRFAAPSAEPGASEETVSLRVLGAVEATPILWHVPASVPRSSPAPLLLALHGKGAEGGEQRALWSSVADALGMIVVAPTEAGPNDGYRFSPRERAATLAALRWARRRFDVDENRVYVTGSSRGGHLTWDLGLRFPGLFAALVPMIGAPRVTNQRAENNLRYVENVAATPILDLQGAKDDARAVANLRLAFERLEALHAADARLLEFPDRGHDFDFEAVDWKAYFPARRRDPAVPRVIRRSATPGEGRALWVEILETDGTVSEEVKPVQPPGWEQMTEKAQRAFVEAEAEKRTARLEVVRAAPGVFRATSTGVKRFRVLLSKDMLEAGKPVVVTWNGREIRRPATASKAVLLGEFVERFDRTFLPVVDVGVP